MPAAETSADIEYRHLRVLIHAHHLAHPVLYDGKERFIHTINTQIYGGGKTTTVYLTGDGAANPLKPEQITLAEKTT